MNPHKLLCLISFVLLIPLTILGQTRKTPTGGRLAIVVDERLSALRATPQLTGKLVRRISRGRLVAIRTARLNADGIVFLLVNLSRRTHGWIQREAVVSPSQKGDDQKLLRLIKGSSEFDRIARGRIFLDHFPRSTLRPEVLLLIGDAIEEVAAKLSRDARRRMNESVMEAPEFSYFLNYSGLDRYNRQDVAFVFDNESKRFHYNGATWRELVRRYPKTPEAIEARKRLIELTRHVHGPR
jgi:hypothetical protein